MTTKIVGCVLGLATGLSLSACGPHSSGLWGQNPVPPPPPTAVDPEGIYTGTITPSGQPTGYILEGIVLADGTAKFFEQTIDASSGAVLAPAKLVPGGSSGRTFSALSFSGFATGTYLFPNGQATETGTLSGTVTPQTSINGGYDASASGGDTGAFTLTYDATDYDIPASFATVAGSYTFAYDSSGSTITGALAIDSQGQITSPAPDSAGCSYTGSLSIPDPAHNAYQVDVTSSCVVGFQFSGLGAFFPGNGGTPATFWMLLSDGSGGLFLTLSQ